MRNSQSSVWGIKAYFTIFLLYFLMNSVFAYAQEINPFTTDGCSLFPDGNLKDRTLWCDCCFIHDIAYWKGGTKDDRMRADVALKACVQKQTGDNALAEMMFLGVRAGGHPAFPTWYRWGYGWPYGRGYKALTKEEEIGASNRLDEYFRNVPNGYCRATQGDKK